MNYYTAANKNEPDSCNNTDTFHRYYGQPKKLDTKSVSSMTSFIYEVLKHTTLIQVEKGNQKKK